jgi:hypothetical protein
MKKINPINTLIPLVTLAIVTLAVALAGCKDDNGAGAELSVTPAEIEAPIGGGSYDIAVTSNTEWTATLRYISIWCTVSPESGSGNGTVTVTVPENTRASIRTATVKVAAGDLSKSVTVTQEAMPPPEYPYNAASAQTWTFGDQTWSDLIHVPSCEGGAFSRANSAEPQCQSAMDGDVLRFHYNWQYVQNNVDDLCPSPWWRVPTKADFETLVETVNRNDLVAAWGLGGFAADGTGGLESANSQMALWSSADWADVFLLISGSAQVVDGWSVKYHGMQVRCIKGDWDEIIAKQ